MPGLPQLHDEIEARVVAIRKANPDWLCAKGCGNCCRHLAEEPRLTTAEWKLLQEGLVALSPDQLQKTRERMAVLVGQPFSPIVCPLLDQSTNACPVYAQRPVACRTYGFYVQRGIGLYCKEIETRVDDGALAKVVWGNHDAIDRQLASMGETRPLTEWFKLWDQDESNSIGDDRS